MDCSLPGPSVHGDSPRKNTRVGCYFLLEGIFPTQGLNLGLLHYRQILYCLSHQGSPKIHTVKAMVFAVVMYRCETWTIKKAECQRIDAFKLWCWRRFLRVPCTTRRSNQSILKEINPEHSLEGLKLKLQSFGHLIRKVDSLTQETS